MQTGMRRDCQGRPEQNNAKTRTSDTTSLALEVTRPETQPMTTTEGLTSPQQLTYMSRHQQKASTPFILEGLFWTLPYNARRGGIQKKGDINESGLPSAKGLKRTYLRRLEISLPQERNSRHRRVTYPHPFTGGSGLSQRNRCDMLLPRG
jgi:hypothetical protein